MAKRKTKNKHSRRRHLGFLAFALFLLLLLGFIGSAALNASILRVRRAEVYIADLPERFEGVRLLYVSDIDLCGLNTAGKSANAFDRLQSLAPDLLVLGGDYTSASLLDVLNRQPADAGREEDIQKCRDFFYYIRDFSAPLGKYAIASPEDIDHALLSTIMRENDVNPLFNSAIEIPVGGDAIWLASICDDSLSIDATSNRFSRGDCVICVSYSPSCFPIVMTLEASDSGPWADLALAGHTHGGQFTLFGHSALSLTDQERQYLYGWSREASIPMLTTSGMGCEGVNLRIGSQPEAWLITLTSHRTDETAHG